MFEYKSCEEDFATKEHLNSHIKFEHEANEKKRMKDILDQFEIQINLQKLQMTEQLLELNIRESYEKETCKCKGNCNINHTKYNWRKRYSQELHSKLLNIKKQDSKENDAVVILETYSCNPWGLNFLNESQLRKHMVTSR
jgi:hypothetical protein